MDQQPIITQFRDSSRFMRTIACIVLTAFSAVMYSPAVFAAYNKVDQHYKYKKDYPVFDELAATVDGIHTQLSAVASLSKSVTAKSATTDSPYQRQRTELSELLNRLDEHEDDAHDYFDDQQRIINNSAKSSKHTKNLTALNTRLKTKEQRFSKDMSALQGQLESLLDDSSTANFTAQAQQALALVEQLRPNKIQHSYDQEMPFGPLDSASTDPITSSEQMTQSLGEPAAAAPTTADLAETVDIQFTADIQAKAGELGNNPIQIYNWVYNNIRYIPSHGSIQGAGHTFDGLKGNAIDTASLTIALMRSAGIHARYQYGTVWLPIDEVMNWVGGVKEPESAQVLLSQGGIPDTLIKINGEFEYVELEHAWVQYWDGSQWLAVDPSFKQYQFTEGVDVAEQVPFDAQTFTDTLQQSAIVNEAEGWVQNVNQAFIETEINDYRQALEDYLNNQQPNATVADILGDQQIIQRTDSSVPALPYQQIRASQALSVLPDNLRHKFKFELQSEFGSTLFTHTDNTATLAGQQIALSFAPATVADEQALIDYLPANPQTPEELPSTIPYGLFNVVGELTVNGQTVASSTALAFGSELKTEKGLWSPKSGWEITSNPVLAAEYQAIGLDLHGVTASQLEALKINNENSQTQITNENYETLTKHDVLGDLLQSGVIGYLAITDMQSQLTAKNSDIVYYREPSYGTFSTSALVKYFFGEPQSVVMTGVLMDMDRIKTSAECNVNCYDNWRDFNQATAQAMSAYEHLIPEQLFSTDTVQVEGVSAIKALAVASQQGQRIYTIDQNNLNTALSALTVDQVIKNEISAAIQTGRVAMIHQHPITYAGWTGVGYSLTDLVSGAGAYKISGGANGGTTTIAEFSIGPITVASITYTHQLPEAFRNIYKIAVDMIKGFSENLGVVVEAAGKLSEAIDDYVFKTRDSGGDIVIDEYLLMAGAGAKAISNIGKVLNIKKSKLSTSPQASLALGVALGLYVAPYLQGALFGRLDNIPNKD